MTDVFMSVLRTVFLWRRRQNANRPILEEPPQKKLKLHEEKKKELKLHEEKKTEEDKKAHEEEEKKKELKLHEEKKTEEDKKAHEEKKKELKLHEEKKTEEEKKARRYEKYKKVTQETLKKYENRRPRTDYEYSSGEDNDYVWPNGKRRRTREEWARYYKQIEESEGFDVDPFPGTSEFGLKALTRFDDEILINSTKAAIEHFNKENDTNYELVKIEKATCTIAAGYWHYITFQAVEGEAEPKIFQAIVFYGIDRSICVDLCRLKKA